MMVKIGQKYLKYLEHLIKVGFIFTLLSLLASLSYAHPYTIDEFKAKDFIKKYYNMLEKGELPEHKVLLEGKYYNVYLIKVEDEDDKWIPVVTVEDITTCSITFFFSIKDNELEDAIKYENGCLIIEKPNVAKLVFHKDTYVINVWMKYPENGITDYPGFLYAEYMNIVKLIYVDHEGDTFYIGIGSVEKYTPAGVALITEKYTVGIAVKEPEYEIFFSALPAFPTKMVLIACTINPLNESKNNVSFTIGFREGEHPELASELFYGKKYDTNIKLVYILLAVGGTLMVIILKLKKK